jgi:bifunctional DNA-binding transcriptional regulator/antitoxin component of YhaV-PrlF toxin-antitoxin module
VTTRITLAADGRINLPVDPRRRMGLMDGGVLLVEDIQYGVILRTVEQSIAEARALSCNYTADKPEASVDAFLANRRAESGE